MKEFEASGGKQIGSGKYATVYWHPKWPYVLKTFTKDDMFLKFARFAYKNPYPPFPKFYGPPKKVVPFYTREQRDKEIYIVRIEKLEPLTDDEFLALNEADYKLTRYFFYKIPGNIHGMFEDEIRKEMVELEKYVSNLPREIYNVLVGKNMLEEVMKKEEWAGAPDWHKGNIMKRANEEYVLIDPVWEGYSFNAYRDHDEAMRAEAGYFDDEDPNYVEPKELRGGELPKTKRIKKPKPVKEPEPYDDGDDDIPF